MSTPEYNKYRIRLESFDNWKGKEIVFEDFASAGFYCPDPEKTGHIPAAYENEGKVVACYECDLTLFNLDSEDDPKKLHSIFVPNCKIAIHSATNREKISIETPTNVLNKIFKLLYGIQVLLGIRKKQQKNRMPMINNTKAINYDPKHSILDTKVMYPQYECYLDRFRSFKNWPKIFQPLKIPLAAGGFFYSGMGDLVYCHFCGEGYKNWGVSDDPLERHHLCSPPDSEAIIYSNKLHESVLPLPIKEQGEQTGDVTYWPDPTRSWENESNLTQPPRICYECRETVADIVFLPCTHLACCASCGGYLEQCPKCHQIILFKIWIYE